MVTRRATTGTRRQQVAFALGRLAIRDRLIPGLARDLAEFFFEQAREQSGPWSRTHVFQTRIRRNIRLAEAPSFGQSIFDYSPNSHGAEDYRQLVRELLGEAQVD